MAAWIACDLPTAACLQPLYGRPKSTDVLMYENAQRRPTLSNDVNVLWRCICSITLYLSFCSGVFICQAAVNLRNSKSLRLALSRATQASPALMAKASCCPSFLDVLQTFADLMMLRRKGLQQSLREGSNMKHILLARPQIKERCRIVLQLLSRLSKIRWEYFCCQHKNIDI